MLEQTDWYRDSAGTSYKVIDLSLDERERACARLRRIALPLARNVFRDLYAYAAPMGEQAQWEVERGEAEAEHITASAENAQEWIMRTPLYEALSDTCWDKETPKVSEEPQGVLGTQDKVVRVYVGVSNTDGRLTIEMWQRFHKDVNACLGRHAERAFTLRWFSPPTEPRMGAAFSARVPTALVEVLRSELDKIRMMYDQDEIAFALATEDFIR